MTTRRLRTSTAALLATAALSLSACGLAGGADKAAPGAVATGGSAGGEATSSDAPGQGAIGDASAGEGTSGEATSRSQALLGAQHKEVPASDTTYMKQIDYITGQITPKSVIANGHGAVIANNMMYTHTVTVYDAAKRELVATVKDSVDLADLGVEAHPGTVQGSPVEAAFTSDGRYAYISNYSMYGSGFGPAGHDDCSPKDGFDSSYTYRLDLESMRIDQAIKVGAVPKYVAVTPDQSKVLVSNWCSYSMSVIDREQGKEIAQVPLGALSRGISVSPDSRYAYATAMGTSNLYRVDLETNTSEVFSTPGYRVRHVVTSPDGSLLYVVSSGRNNGDGSTNIAKIDAATGTVLDTVMPGNEPRTLAMSPDGRAVYVVNYRESTLAKVRTDTMEVVQKIPTDGHPIGVTYEPTTGTVWIANYGGSIQVIDDTVDAAQAGGTVVAPQG